MHWFLRFVFGIKFYMFRTVPLSIIRRFSLYTQQCYMYVWHTLLLCVHRKTPDDGQRNCPKHVAFYSKNKFEKLVKIFGFIIRIYHNARSPERQTHKNIGFKIRHVNKLKLERLLYCLDSGGYRKRLKTMLVCRYFITSHAGNTHVSQLYSFVVTLFTCMWHSFSKKGKAFPVHAMKSYRDIERTGHAVAHLVEALRYKPEGRRFDSQWCQWNFSFT